MSERRETRETAYAHSGEGSPGPGWHDLAEHLRGVAARSRVASAKWGGGDLGRVAGLWHDLGKYAPDWQEFLREVGADASATEADPESGPPRRRRGPDHSSAGAMHALA